MQIYCTVTLPGNPIRQFVARLKAFLFSLKAFLPPSDFDRREIALNAITSAVRFVGENEDWEIRDRGRKGERQRG